MLSPERLDALQQGWVRLLAGYDVPAADAYPAFDRLVAAYGEPHRRYHTLEHVAEMLRVVGRLRQACDDPSAVQLAVWFHDAVYDPRAKDNEERSAALAREMLTPLGVPPVTTERVVRLILATAHEADVVVPADPDTDVLMDADLAILGSADDRYDRYAGDVRKEYEWVPDADFRAGRAAVLRRFLAQPKIYRTDLMRLEGEVRARANLVRELCTHEADLKDSRNAP